MKIESEFPGKKVIIFEPYYSGALLLKIIEQVSISGCEVMQIGVPKEFLEKYGTYQEQLHYLKLDIHYQEPYYQTPFEVYYLMLIYVVQL
jgi:hypothetical protein